VSADRLSNVSPVEYLADVIPRLARRIRLRDMYALMPARRKPIPSPAEVMPEQAAAQKQERPSSTNHCRKRGEEGLAAHQFGERQGD
jgi:hypothetical protein